MKSSKPLARWFCAMLLAVVAGTLCLGQGTAFSAAAEKTVQQKQIGAKIDLNTASLKDLMSLPGIGKSTAEAIIAHRKKAPFRSVEELREIKGVKAKTLKKIAALVTV